MILSAPLSLGLNRRTDIGGPTQPAAVATAVARWDASAPGSITATGGAVSAWADLSGNGRNLTQSTAGNRPTTGAATQNGLNVITFAADWVYASTAADWTFLHSTPTTVYMVVKPGTAADPNVVYQLLGTQIGSTQIGYELTWDDRLSSTRNQRVAHYVARGVSGQLNTSNVSADNAMPANAFALLSVVADPTAATGVARSSMRVDGGAAIANNTLTNALSAAAPTVPLFVGAADAVGFTALVGSIAEIIIFGTAHSTQTREDIEGWLAEKWGVAPALWGWLAP